jgi:hypothetical protein
MQPNKVAAAKSVTAERAGFAGFAVLSIIGLLSIIRTKKTAAGCRTPYQPSGSLWPAIAPPPVSQFELWFDIHRNDFGTVVYGIEECLRLYNQRGGLMDQDHAIRHSSRVMNCYSKDRAHRKKSNEHFPLNILTKNLADAIGQPGLAGVALTEGMYWRCQRRALAIRQGRIPAPSIAVPNSDVAQTRKVA